MATVGARKPLPQSQSDPAVWAAQIAERRARRESGGDGRCWQSLSLVAGGEQLSRRECCAWRQRRGRYGGGVLEGSAASIVFHSRWVSPHREGTDGMRFLLRAGVRSGPSPWSECSGADEVVSRHPAFSAEESPRLGVKTRLDYY